MNQGDEHKTLSRSEAWRVVLLALNAVLVSGNVEEAVAICWALQNNGSQLKFATAKRLPEIPPHDWDAILRAAEAAYLDMGIDPTNGATIFRLAALKTPKSFVLKCRIGGFRFYTEQADGK